MNYNKYIDHTLLKPDATMEDIKKLCAEAVEQGFYSVCVNPCYVKLASSLLKGSGVKVAAVVGFPLGTNATSIKKAEAVQAVKDGAREIDMVINNGFFKSGLFGAVIYDINQVCECGVPVKVIVETSLLSKQELVDICNIVNKTDAAFIKTSTGFVGGGATVENVEVMKKHCTKKIKASGGIRDAETMLKMINAGADRIGTSSGVKIMETLNESNLTK